MSIRLLRRIATVAGLFAAVECGRTPPRSAAGDPPQPDAGSLDGSRLAGPASSFLGEVGSIPPTGSAAASSAAAKSPTGADQPRTITSAPRPCKTVQALRLALGGRDALASDRVTWLRCTEPDPSHPSDRLILQMHGADATTTLYSNQGSELVECLGSIDGLRLTDEGNELLYVVRMYGTGNIWAWTVVDWRDGKLRTWTKPDESAALARLGRANETIQHQVGAGPVVRGRGLVVSYLIYEGDECQACASGGVAKLELAARDGAFRVVRAWRETDH